MKDDLPWMRRALRLARRGLGLTRPNPPVGAVLVSADGTLLGEGWHHGAGQPHAEIEALRAAISACGCQMSNVQQGSKNREVKLKIENYFPVENSLLNIEHLILYITLEPCSTHGRTPPCTDAILAAGISRVVVACQDPNPCHAGRGIKILRDAGVRVDVGVCEDEARELIAPFAKHITQQLPFVTLKLGMTLDGRIADINGQSKWITGEKSRAYVQRLRAQSDAILVGANTVIADNPGLLPPKPHPKFLRLILDPRLRTPPESRVYTDKYAAQTIIVVGASSSRNVASYTAHGARIFPLPRELEAPATFSLRGILHRLAVEENLTSILCEGGGVLAASLASENLVDRYELFYAPSLLLNGIPAFNATPGLPLANRLNLKLVNIKHLGDDVLLRLKNNEF